MPQGNAGNEVDQLPGFLPLQDAYYSKRGTCTCLTFSKTNKLSLSNLSPLASC